MAGRAAVYVLGLTYWRLNRNDEAEKLYKRALSIQDKIQPADNSRVIPMLNSIASLYEAEHRFAESEETQKRELVLKDKKGGPDDEVREDLVFDLAVTEMHLDKWKDAAQFSSEASSTARRPSVPTTAEWRWWRPGSPKAKWGRNTIRRPSPSVQARAITIDEKADAEGRDLATALHTLGFYYLDGERYADAEAPLKRAYEILQKR